MTDENNEPIEGATVKTWLGEDDSRGPEPVLTKKNGRFAFGGLRFGVAQYFVENVGQGHLAIFPAGGEEEIERFPKSLPGPLPGRLPKPLFFHLDL